MLLLLLKKTLTLLALIEPFSVIPIYLATVSGLPDPMRERFARALGLTVAIALLLSGLFGMQLLSMLGVSMDGMRVGGGLITLILAIAMVIGHEKDVKQGPYDESESIKGQGHTIVPLGIPLLVGPATLAYMTIHSDWRGVTDVVGIVVPSLLCGIAVWVVFASSQRAQPYLTQSTLSIIERLAGFLLAGIAVDLIAGGLTGLFPILKGNA
jgi:multiple antibiotic resistance protein